MPDSTLTIREIRDRIVRTAHERRESIERGEYDVPLRGSPLPLGEMLDLLSQWEYRRDSLALAVPPPAAGLGARLSRFCKNLVCKSLRWLLIRQVECNAAAIRHGQAVAELLALVDRNQTEFMAALTNLKLQIGHLANQVAELRGRQTVPDTHTPLSLECLRDSGSDLQAHQVYLDLLSGGNSQGRIPSCLILGSGRGDLLRFLTSEGMQVSGVEPEIRWFEYCRERELPVFHAGILDFLESVKDGSLGGIVIERKSFKLPARQLSPLLQRCWQKLHKDGILIAELENSCCVRSRGDTAPRLPIEDASFLIESQCFELVDLIFSAPLQAELPEFMLTSTAVPFDQKQYRNLALAGRK
jgi:hypothetical protein